MILFIDGNKFKFDDSNYKGIKSKNEIIFDLSKINIDLNLSGDYIFFKDWFIKCRITLNSSLISYLYKKDIICLRGKEKRILYGCFPTQLEYGCITIRYDSYSNAEYLDDEENYLTGTELKLISFEEYKNKILLK